MLIRHEKALVAEVGVTDAWDLVRRTQEAKTGVGWLIPQPAHSALSGEIAAKLEAGHFPGLNEKILRSISLHDAGWSPFDASQIVKSREPKFHAVSFIEEKPEVYLAAWTDSINLAEKNCAECGYMVSRHFEVLGKADADAGAKEKLAQFDGRERERQQRLERASEKPHEELERLWQALRFCDLLSLFLCCNIELNAQAEVRFGDYVLGRGDNDDLAFPGDSPLRERAEVSFSGVGFGGKGGGWFRAALR